MARVSYESAVKDAFMKAAANARAAGKTWNEAFVCAQKAGYKGSASTLQKLVRAQPVAPKKAPANYKNAAKTNGSNAFKKAKASPAQSTPVAEKASERAPETLESIQNRLPVLRDGTYYTRPISLFDGHFQNSSAGEIMAWSRILGQEEAVCVTNSHDQYRRGADVLVDSTLNPPGPVTRTSLELSEDKRTLTSSV